MTSKNIYEAEIYAPSFINYVEQALMKSSSSNFSKYTLLKPGMNFQSKVDQYLKKLDSDFCWSMNWSTKFYCQLMYQGFLRYCLVFTVQKRDNIKNYSASNTT